MRTRASSSTTTRRKRSTSSSSSLRRNNVTSLPKSRTNNKKNEVTIEVGSIDYTILITVLLLVIIGIVMIFSSSYYISYAKYKDPYHFLRMQFLVSIMGFIIMMCMSNFNYRYLKRFAKMIYILSVSLSILVMFFGKTSNGATRWLIIPGIGIGIQPSEIAKVATIIMTAKIISSNQNMLKTLKGTIYVSMFTLILTVLIGIENLSTAIIISIIGFGIIFIASPYTLIFIVLGICAAGSLVSYIGFFSTNFRSGRFEAWLNPESNPTDKGYQVLQSLYAIASGGIFGLGLGQSRQKLGFLPEAHNDIVFSIICEELGLAGAGLVLFLFGVLLWRTIRVAMTATDLFGSLIASGIALMIGSQVIINVAVVTNTIPNTGVPLPFISYGGTSLAIMMSTIGILLNISRYSKK